MKFNPLPIKVVVSYWTELPRSDSPLCTRTSLQWGLRPVLAGEERNRFSSAPAELHTSILAANKVSVQRNLGPVIGAPGASVLADSFSGTVSPILNNTSL